MFGRTKLCLLAILLAVVQANLPGQNERRALARPIVNGLSDLAQPLSETNPENFVPIPVPPRSPVLPPGVFGFPQLARAAGMIFSGKVRSIRRIPASRGQAVETVAITFHIENAIRGATPGEDITVEQWIGLWSSGQRYRVGERLLLFLYPPSKLGLTSSVGGLLGRFAIDPGGRVLLTAQHLAAFQRDPVMGGRSRVRISDFALAVRRAGGEE